MQDESVDGEAFAALFAAPSVEAIRALAPRAFQAFVAYCFQREGTYDAVVVDGGEDGGIDIELRTREVPRYTVVAVVQCKGYTSRVAGGREIRAFISAMEKAHVRRGYFFATTGFTPGAWAAARGHSLLWLLAVPDLVRWIAQVHAAEQQRAEQPSTTPRTEPAPSVPVLAVANNKGGVGKTLVAAHVAAALAGPEGSVLLVDMDPQADLTKWLTNRVVPAPLSLYGVLVDEHPVAPLVQRTSEPYVWLLPAAAELERLPRSAQPYALERTLRTALAHLPTLDPPIRYVVLDTPPALGTLTRAALVAASALLIPLRLDNPSYDGVKRLLDFVAEVERLHALPPLTILGGVANSVSPTPTRLGTSFLEMIPTAAAGHPRLRAEGLTAERFWCGVLRQREDYLRARNQLRTVLTHVPTSDATAEARQLAQEVAARLLRATERPLPPARGA